MVGVGEGDFVDGLVRFVVDLGAPIEPGEEAAAL